MNHFSRKIVNHYRSGLAIERLGIRVDCTTVAAQMALPTCTFHSTISIADIGLWIELTAPKGPQETFRLPD